MKNPKTSMKHRRKQTRWQWTGILSSPFGLDGIQSLIMQGHYYPSNFFWTIMSLHYKGLDPLQSRRKRIEDDPFLLAMA